MFYYCYIENNFDFCDTWKGSQGPQCSPNFTLRMASIFSLNVSQIHGHWEIVISKPHQFNIRYVPLMSHYQGWRMMHLHKPGSDRASSGSLNADKFSALAGQVCRLRGEPGNCAQIRRLCEKQDFCKIIGYMFTHAHIHIFLCVCALCFLVAVNLPEACWTHPKWLH